MAKKEKLEPVSTEHSALQGLLTSQQVKYGERNVYVAGDGMNRVLGVAMPSLAMEWVTNMTVWPAQKMIAVAGPSKSGKSTLGFEFVRWIKTADENAAGRLIEGEGNKVNFAWLKGIVDDDLWCDNSFVVMQARVAEDAQNFWTDTVEFMTKAKIHRTPVIIGLDSLSALGTQASQEKFAERGHSAKSFPDGPLVWTDFLKKAANMLLDVPVFFYWIAHLKDPIASDNPMDKKKAHAKRMPGGEQQKFGASFVLWVDAIGGRPKTRTDYWFENEWTSLPRGMRTMSIKTAHSTYGPSGRSCEVDVIYLQAGLDAKGGVPADQDKPDEGNRLRAWFDWDGADCRLLERLQNGEDEHSQVDAKRLRTVIDLKKSKDGYASERLGVEKLPDYAIGDLIHKNIELKEQIRDVLGIPRYRVAFPWRAPKK